MIRATAFIAGSRMKVLIIGAGIAGLTLNALLRQHGFTSVIVEERGALQGGYTLLLWSPGLQVLRNLGLYRAVREAGQITTGRKAYDPGGRMISEMRYEDVVGGDQLPLSIERTRLVKILAKNVDRESVSLSTTVDGFFLGANGVQTRFSDDTSAEFDVVVACDGLWSETRRHLFGDQPVIRCGWRAWAWWLSSRWRGDPVRREYWGPGKNVGILPAKHGACCYCATAGHDFDERICGKRGWLREALASMGGEVPQVVEELPADEAIWTDSLFEFRARYWSERRVALVGDAAVTCLPTPGFGASLAMESAETLAHCLTNFGRDAVGTALKVYAERQKRRAERFQTISRRFARIGMIQSRAGAAIRNYIVSALSMRFGHKLLLNLPS